MGENNGLLSGSRESKSRRTGKGSRLFKNRYVGGGGRKAGGGRLVSLMIGMVVNMSYTAAI